MVFLASMADAVGQDRFARRRAFRGAERGAASPPRAMGRFHGSDKSDLRDVGGIRGVRALGDERLRLNLSSCK